MWRSKLLVAAAFAILSAMIWLDWRFPTPLFYAPSPQSTDVARWFLLKKIIEIVLSVCLICAAAIVLLSKRTGITERCLMSAAIGMGAGFWIHPDLVYLLLR